MIDKKIHTFTIILLLMCFIYGCGIKTDSKTEKFIDYNHGVENLSDEDAIKLVKEIVSFMDTGIETGEAVEGVNGENFAYMLFLWSA